MTTLLIGLVAAGALWLPPALKARRRERLRREPFPAAWESLLTERLALYRRLPEAQRAALEGHILVFLAEKRYYGCGGLAITDSMRVLIAAQACLLILNRETDYFAQLRSILVYPSAFLVPRETTDAAGVSTLRSEARIGESWEIGRVILAWDEVEDRREGQNVVIHEFAHQLDQEGGVADGTPVLRDRASYRSWAEVLGREFRALREQAARGEPTLLDPYGAESAGEFFAVATECFFEQSERLSDAHPALYAALRDYYRVDPATWHR